MIQKTINTVLIFLLLQFSSNLVNAQSITITSTSITFAKTPIGFTTSGLHNFRIYGTGLVANIDINSFSTAFQIATSSSGPWLSSLSLTPTGGTVSITTIYVRYVPAVAGNVANTIDCTSSGATTRTVNVSGFGLAAAPTTSSCILTAVANPGTPGSALDFTFSAGNGQGRVLVLRQGGQQPNFLPVNGTAYLTLTDWAAAASTINELSVPSLVRVVYVGNATSTTVTGLNPSTQYTARVMEFNNGGISGAENYYAGGSCSIKGAPTGSSGSYTWTGATSNDFSVATNWTPNRTSPASADVLQFTSSPSGAVTNVTSQTIGQLILSGSANVELQASSTSTLNIAGVGANPVGLDIPLGCTLTVAGSNPMTIALSRNLNLNGVMAIRDANHSITNSAGYSYGTSSNFIYYGNATMNISPIQYGNLTIHSSANSSVIAPSGTLLINSRFNGSSYFIHNNGTVHFNGGVQTISGSNTFNNVILANTSAKTITSGASNVQTIRGTLTFTSTGSLVTNGNLVLFSDASATGRIAALPGTNQIVGNITVQRYIPAGPRNSIFHLTAPVNGATVSQWQPTQFNGSGQPTNGFYITGIFTGASNPGYGITSTGVSMYGYDAANGVYGNYPATSNGEPLTAGVGYRVSLRDGTAAYFSGMYCAKTISVTGAANTGTFSYSLSYNPTGGTNPIGGWNLLGNPYPSDITADLSNGGWNTVSANLGGNDVYIWSSLSNSFVTCNNGVGNCVIPSSQGFWVRTTTGGGTFQSNESVKVSGSTTIYKQSALANVFSVKLISDQYMGYDEAYVGLENDATKQFDAQYDAYEPFALYPEGEYQLGVYSVSGENSFSINTIPMVDLADTISLYVKAPEGNALIEFNDVDKIDAAYNVYLWDKSTNNVVDLRQNSAYPFIAKADNSQYGVNRFNIIIARSSVTVNNVESMNLIAYPNPAAGYSDITLSSDVVSDSEVDIMITDNIGRIVYSDKANVSGGKLRYNVPASALPSGLYTVSCKGNSQSFVTKLAVK